MVFLIDKTWDGRAVEPAEAGRVELVSRGEEVSVLVDAPFHGDPPPPGPPGATDRLWEHEVVEVFLLGRDERYLEIELGPHGHHLALELRGVRRVVRSRLPLGYESRIEGARWRGAATFPRTWLPAGLERGNAYAIHGAGSSRRHLAAHPVPGDAPDFHRLACFGPLRLDRA